MRYIVVVCKLRHYGENGDKLGPTLRVPNWSRLVKSKLLLQLGHSKRCSGKLIRRNLGLSNDQTKSWLGLFLKLATYSMLT